MYSIKKKNNRYYVYKKGASRASKSFDTLEEAQSYVNSNSKGNSNQNTISLNKSYKKKNHAFAYVGIALVFLALIAVIVIYLVKPEFITKFINGNNTNNKQTEEIKLTDGVMYDDFQIHFMTLGNDKAGDSVYIKAGETDILIDAGSRSGSSKTTLPYMQKYVKDNKLEYIIVTHGDQDHIEAFPSILNTFSVDNIILNRYSNKTTAAYNNMLQAFDNQVSKGAHKYYADECLDMKNDAKHTYKLSDNVTMEILWNEYYWHTSTDENNYSVCTLFTYKNLDITKTFMLTGDLEKEGEEALANYYDSSTLEKTLPKVDLYKAGHHGSKTSSNDCLLNIIQPKMCVVSCCCGTDEYTGATANQFPTQQFIDRIAKWTDAVYVTTIYDTYTIEKAKYNGKGKSDKTGVAIGDEYIHTSGFKDMNGNICVSCGLKSDTQTIEIGLACSNNTIKLKDSDWMNMEITINGVLTHVRTMPKEWQ